MPFQIKIEPDVNNINTTDLKELMTIMTRLQIAKANIRSDAYQIFMNTRRLLNFTGLACIPLIFYLLTKDIFYLYLSPISLLVVVVILILLSESLTHILLKEIESRIDIIREKIQELQKVSR